MNVLVDTSVWVGHFKQRNERLAALLEDGRVVCHPYVVTEVACGTPPNRRAIIAMLAELESGPLATPDEILELIERRGLYGRGCGFVDMSLLASALLSDQTLIWTLDKRLESVAAGLNRAYRAALHS
ncbi:type II toxin-antitoxin system VapC family toxin [Polaromonas naphthalenivorans]|uniref:Ribonuclease VapC n=1 Tax=Polaromonas naphthalenivorans (strain CJ2) TaxID=365044 RepID=A1VX33_POLNA|nr:PIN domain-containing protein [Polaromonas naphthalenivorans]ABM40211.1 PilT protein domain protein [Polaromonas naphthalenivorans CJ2]